MNAQDLKNSILQLAIQGKLVEQRKEEGTAKELIEEIKAEKERLIKEKKIKKEKPLAEITEDEVPFEIPESWEWVRLENICEYIQRGKSPKYSDIQKYPVVAQKCNQWAGFSIEKAKFIDPDTINKYTPERFLQDRDLMWNSTGLGTLGRMAIYYVVLNPYELAVADSHVTVIRALKEVISYRYLYYYFTNPSVQNIIEKQSDGSTKQKELATSTIKNYILPLPPLAEQKRIVAKIEELMPYIQKYGEAHSKLEVFNKKFTDDMQKSILQYAIQGKLVEQREEEGTAEELYKQIQEEKEKLIKEKKIKKEKPLAEIIEDEMPFDIPESWKWVRFGDIMINRDAERIPLSVSERESLQKIYDYYGASGIIDKVDKYIFDKKLMLIGEDGANLLTRSKPIAFLAEGKYWVNNHAHVIDCGEYIHMEYIMYYINAISLAKYVTGTAQPKMNQAKMNSIPVPLPPLAEQKRIVAKIEEMLPYCKQLVK